MRMILLVQQVGCLPLNPCKIRRIAIQRNREAGSGTARRAGGQRRGTERRRGSGEGEEQGNGERRGCGACGGGRWLEGGERERERACCPTRGAAERGGRSGLVGLWAGRGASYLGAGAPEK